MSDAQIVVAGAGHNSLITAAYLAVAGYSVLVLDSREIPGGGAASEELLGPGYVIDSCSTGHTLIQINPLLLKDAWAIAWNEKPHLLDVQVDGLVDFYIGYAEVGFCEWFDSSGVALITT